MSIFKSVGTSITGMTLNEATKAANLDWTVAKQPIYTGDLSNPITSNRHFATVRSDTQEILGIVGPDYQVLQNQELAWMVSRLSSADLKVETAGYINGGSRVWYQTQGNPFDVGPKKDTNVPMCLFTNGHDGQWSLSALPVTFRIICENTLNMAITKAKSNNTIISLKHTGNIQDRLESMFLAISEFKERTEEFENKAQRLGNTPLNTEQIQKFWTGLYMEMFGGIYSNPTAEYQVESNALAKSTLTKWTDNFDSEVKDCGANMWTAMNAVTFWLDHQQIYRGDKKLTNQFNDILFGNRSKQKLQVLSHALMPV